MKIKALYLIWMTFSAVYCSNDNSTSRKWDTAENSMLATAENDTDSKNSIRCDTIICKRANQLEYIWAIHNFSVLEKIESDGHMNSIAVDHYVTSPYLHAYATDRPQWYVEVSPNGFGRMGVETEKISLKVFLSKRFYPEPETTLAKYAVSIINDKKDVLWSRNTTKYEPAGYDYSHLWWEYCKKDDFFHNKLLQNDTLIFLIRITWIYTGLFDDFTPDCPRAAHNTAENVTRCDTYVNTRPHRIKYTWVIHNFSVHEAKGQRVIELLPLSSPINDGWKWELAVNPNDRCDKENPQVCLEVQVQAPIAGGAFAEVNDKTVNQKNENQSRYEGYNFNIDRPNIVRYMHLSQKDDLFRNQILYKDTLILQISIRWITGLYHVISGQREISPPVANSIEG
ncbi:uncharacterized protein LOC135848512 [Planococcus citri]|uniref:uncharacterized protein LOC135848512 n=1 Tax=Planococcus citri TaxID=170843 RepID=UPI0031F880FB